MTFYTDKSQEVTTVAYTAKELVSTLGLQLEHLKEAADYAIRQCFLLYAENVYLSGHGAWVDLKLKPGQDENIFRNQVYARLRMERNTRNAIASVVSFYVPGGMGSLPNQFDVCELMQPSCSFIIGVSLLGSNAMLLDYDQCVKGIIVFVPDTLTAAEINAIFSDLTSMKEAGAKVGVYQKGKGIVVFSGDTSIGLNRSTLDPNLLNQLSIGLPSAKLDYAMFPAVVDANGVITGSALNRTISPFGVGVENYEILQYSASTTPTPIPTPPPPPTTYQSIYVSPTGNDTNVGTTPAAPFATFTKAASVALPGAVVNLLPGTYNQQLVTASAGLSGNEILWQAYNGVAVINGVSGVTQAPNSENLGLVQIKHAFNRFKGITVTNAPNTGMVIDADNITIDGCQVNNCQQHGIGTASTRAIATGGVLPVNTTVMNCTINNNGLANNGGRGIRVIGDGFSISKNVCHHNWSTGILMGLGSKHGACFSNECYQNGNVNNVPQTKDGSIYIDGAKFVRVYANNLHGEHDGIGISSETAGYSTESIWVYNNSIHDNNNEGILIYEPNPSTSNLGSINIKIFNNSIYNVNTGIYLNANSLGTGDVFNNLIYATLNGIKQETTDTGVYNINTNVVLTAAQANSTFVSTANRDLHLSAADTLARDKGGPIPKLVDDIGNTYTVGTDYDGAARVFNSIPDVGAYEYHV
jgi:hypothetical protein